MRAGTARRRGAEETRAGARAASRRADTDRQGLFLLHRAVLHRLLRTAVAVVVEVVMLLLLLLLLLVFLLFFLLLLFVFRGLLLMDNKDRRKIDDLLLKKQTNKQLKRCCNVDEMKQELCDIFEAHLRKRAANVPHTLSAPWELEYRAQLQNFGL